ncbi:MAG: saccharopine dehydrogenase NADP-binding domain-containing protein [Deltaproteobacteria bacterium]|nr:saccharopine dehydrogenase NADP-binding domain-containing protein [Deltaproteobacteria bacterium]
MKAVVLGGCADMAVPLLRLMRGDGDFERVVIADLNQAKARKIALEHGSKFEGVHCDAQQPESVVGLIRGSDVVFGYVGPFYVFEKKLARCAIDAGVPYVSISDDYDAYLDVVILDESARAAGVKILTGFGNSPGLTQILARQGYNEVPSPYRISVNWCAGSSEDVGPSNLTHLFHIFNGTTLQTFDGKEIRVRAGAGKKLVEFPAPIGFAHVYYTGHAESVSLPRNLPGLREVTLHGGVKPGYIVDLLRAMSSLRLFATHRRRTRLARFFHRVEGLFASEGLDRSVGRVEVYGSHRGQTQMRYFTYVGHIAEITSYPAFLAAKWLLQKRFDDKPGGVYAAEKLLHEPTGFLAELRAMGIEMYEGRLGPAE